MNFIRDKLANIGNNLRGNRDGDTYTSDDSDYDCGCEEAIDCLVIRIGKLEAAFEVLNP